MLDKKLEEHRLANPGWSPPSGPAVLDLTDDDDSQASVSQGDGSSGSDKRTNGPTKRKAGNKGPAKKRPARQYVPLPRSGAHAILVTLGRRRTQLKASWTGASCHDWMSKSDLIVAAQPLCSMFSPLSPPPCAQPLADSHYTAWSSMATLIRRGLVSKQGCPARFSLTDEGEELANRIMAPGTPCDSAASSSDECQPPPRCSDSDDAAFRLAPMRPPLPPLDTLCIVLLVDCSETTASSQERFLRELRELELPHEVRRLTVGDFAWLCRSSSPSAEGGPGRQEWVLGPLVRLVSSGVRPLVYLVEEAGGKGSHCIADSALEQGVLNTQVSEGFVVQRTRDPRDTACFLGIVTCHLQAKLAAATSSADLLEGRPTWEEFSAGGLKSRGLQVREMLALTLLQVKGLSLDRVMPLVERYPTPARSGCRPSPCEALFVLSSQPCSRWSLCVCGQWL
ncbi:hypothetical protein HPB48_027032 [Haemaphysalis longicornis]|uniref:Crossover junction endonuclease MUS81 n=1 Tax=Haemaphysalis longicornis TaxID=44386 RepID=A0A9J6HAY1_HAELO|nr:hypothetical protein HPB48_027032 [Haemaphysalis longicornis]